MPRGATLIEVLIIVSIIALFVGFAFNLSSCGSKAHEQATIRAAESMGMKDVRITGYEWFGCGEEDSYRDGFTAIGADGKVVHGIGCSGYNKGVTIRFKVNQ